MNLKIGTFFGVPLYLHWSFFLVIIFFSAPVIAELVRKNEITVVSVAPILVILSVFFFVTLHEYGHCLAAKCFGMEVQDVTIFILGGVARIQLDFTKPMIEFWVVLAGPAVNLFIAGTALALSYLPILSLYQDIFFFIFAINIVLAMFNLLPVFPMDGGRILRSILYCLFEDGQKATFVAVRFSQCAATILCVAAFYYGFYLAGGIFVLTIFLSQSEMDSFNIGSIVNKIKRNLSIALNRSELERYTVEQIVQELRLIEDEETKKLIGRDDLLEILQPLARSDFAKHH